MSSKDKDGSEEESAEEEEEEEEDGDDEEAASSASSGKGPGLITDVSLRASFEREVSSATEGQESAADGGGTPPAAEKSSEERARVKDLLSKSFMFSELGGASLEQVINSFLGPLVVEPGGDIITQGDEVADEHPGIYVLEEGAADVYTASAGAPRPGERVFTYDRAGDTFGEVALLYDCPRAAAVVAADKSVLWHMSRGAFNDCVKDARVQARAGFTALLGAAELFSELSADSLARIADGMQMRTFQQGDAVVREGAAEPNVFVVQEGALLVSQGGERVAELAARGQCYGDDPPHAVDVVAGASPTQVGIIDGAVFRRVCGHLSSRLHSTAASYGVGPAPSGALEEEDEAGSSEQGSVVGPLRSEVSSATAGIPLAPAFSSVRSDASSAQQAADRTAADALEPIQDVSPQLSEASTQSKASRPSAAASQASKVPSQTSKGSLNPARGEGDGGERAPIQDAESPVARASSRAGELSELEKFLATVVILNGIPPEQLQELALALTPRAFQAGDIIVGEGAEDRDFFIVQRGSAVAEANGRHLRQYGAGQHFGLSSVFFERPFDATIFADATPTDVLALDAASFRRTLGQLEPQLHSEAEEFARLLTDGPQEAVPALTSGQVPSHALGDSDIQAALAVQGPSRQASPITDALVAAELEEDDAYASDSDDEALPAEERVALLQQLSAAAAARSKATGNPGGRRWGVSEEPWRPLQVYEAGTRPAGRVPAEVRAFLKASISALWVFHALPSETLDSVLAAFKGPYLAHAGAEIVREGAAVLGEDPAFFVLERGELEAFRAPLGRHPPGGRVASYERGHSFGMLGLLHYCTHEHTLVAASDVRLWSLDRQSFAACVKGSLPATRSAQVDLLSSLQLVPSLQMEDFHRIADVLQTRICCKNEALARNGDDATHLFVVQEGAAFTSATGVRHNTTLFGQGQYFGDLALVDTPDGGCPCYPADFVADKTPTKLLVLEGQLFKSLVGPVMSRTPTKHLKDGAVRALCDRGQSALGSDSWRCAAKRCAFWNFGHSQYCLKCCLPRPDLATASSVTASSLAAPFPSSRPDVGEGAFLPHVASTPGSQLWPWRAERAADRAGALPAPVLAQARRGSGNAVRPRAPQALQDGLVDGAWFVLRHSQRLAETAGAQGLNPLCPGESFQAAIFSLGTFGEISIGLAPLGTDEDGILRRTTPMVGWAANEVGYHGDHGRWYCKGKLPGFQASTAWEVGDLIECGLTEVGKPYFARNGAQVAVEQLQWHMDHSYPTVTIRSSGGEVALNLRHIKPKRHTGRRADPDTVASKVHASLKKSADPGPVRSSRRAGPTATYDYAVVGNALSWLRWPLRWPMCSCSDLRMAGAT